MYGLVVYYLILDVVKLASLKVLVYWGFCCSYFNDLPEALDYNMESCADNTSLSFYSPSIHLIGHKLSIACEMASIWMEAIKF